MKKWTSMLLAAALALTMMSCALAETGWQALDRFENIFGENPVNADAVMQRDVYSAAINENVDITIDEVGYDGRILLLAYTHKFKNEETAFADEEYPEGADELMEEANVGWWTDNIWIDGKAMSMPGGSVTMQRGTGKPGEIQTVEYWWLDHEGVTLSGEVEISLPIGERQALAPKAENPELYDADGKRKLPEQGVVTFKFDAGDAAKNIVIETPDGETETGELTVKIAEAAYSPLLTYVKMSYEAKPEALAAYIEKNGEGVKDESGSVMREYSALDLARDWLDTLQLVDKDGKVILEDALKIEMMGDDGAEFIIPHIENLPDELFIAPVGEDGKTNMDEAVKLR